MQVLNNEGLEFLWSKIKEYGSLPMLRHIQVGDNLSGKTIYCKFPSNLNISNDIDNVILFNTGYHIAELDTPSVILYSSSLDGSSVATFFEKKTDALSGNEEYVNLTNYTLSNDVGLVTEVDMSAISYQYLYIADGFTSLLDRVLALEEKTSNITVDENGTHISSGLYCNGNEVVCDDDYKDPSNSENV